MPVLKSMTGYGRGEYSLHEYKAVVEIRAVNHRYCDIACKMPRTLLCFEDKLRKKLAEQIHRGKVDVYVTLESGNENSVSISVNTALAKSYVSAVKELGKTLGIKGGVKLRTVVGFPDVVTVTKHAATDDELLNFWQALDIAAQNAIANFLLMRETEGKALCDDILLKLNNMKELTDRIVALTPGILKEYEARLRTRISELLDNVSVDENRLLMETAIFADRSSVDEELTRLLSHISQMKDMLRLNEEVGRKLDFIVQEMNREINTIGSKSNDINISGIVVDLKSELEKIREQVQNIE